LNNISIRIIYKKPLYESQKSLLKISELESVEERFKELNLRYLNNAMYNGIIEEIVDDFVGYHEQKMKKYKTFLGNII